MSADRSAAALGMAVLLLGAAACSGGDGGASTTAFCNQIKAEQQKSGETDAETAAALDKLVSLAPSEIKAEMEQIRDFNASSSSIGSDFSAQITDLDAAVSKLTQFVKDKCGVDLNGDNSSKFSSVANSIN